MRFYYLTTRKAETNTNPGKRFGMTPRRGGGKARRIPTTPPPAAAAPKSRPRKGGAAPGRPPTSSPARPPAARTKAKRLPREATDAGAKCRREPGRARRNAISRRHPPFQWHQERAGNAPNSGTEPPSHAARLRGKEREKENRQLRCGLVGGTTARTGLRGY